QLLRGKMIEPLQQAERIRATLIRGVQPFRQSRLALPHHIQKRRLHLVARAGRDRPDLDRVQPQEQREEFAAGVLRRMGIDWFYQGMLLSWTNKSSVHHL